MTQKHYIEIARMLDGERELARHTPNSEVATNTIRTITFQLAQIMKRDNRNFKAGKFFDAAGFPELTNTAMGMG